MVLRSRHFMASSFMELVRTTIYGYIIKIECVYEVVYYHFITALRQSNNLVHAQLAKHIQDTRHHIFWDMKYIIYGLACNIQ